MLLGLARLLVGQTLWKANRLYQRVQQGRRPSMSASALPRPDEPLRSCLCSQAQLQSARFSVWAERMGEEPRMHRKQWEFCYIAQALHERG